MRVAKNVFKHVVKLRNVVEFHLQNSNHYAPIPYAVANYQ